MNSVQAAAAWFALLPMAVGLAILGSFVLIDDERLAFAGFLWLYVGFAANVAGALLVIVGHLRARRDGMAPAQRWRVTGCLATLLLAAWPVAVVCADAGIEWWGRYTVELENRSPTAWNGVLRAPGVDEALAVPAGTKAVRHLLGRDTDGGVTLHSGEHTVVLCQYACMNTPGRSLVVRDADGAMRVVEQSIGR